MRTFAILAACGFAFWGSAPAQDAKPLAVPALAPETLDLVFLGEHRPILLRLHLQVDGKPMPIVWRAYLKKWFDYLDRDGDGKLSGQEIQYAPRDQAMLQMMRQGGFFQQAKNNPLAMADFNKDANDKLALDDFCRYYERQRAGAVQVVASAANNVISPVSDALFKLLDRNRDGKLSRAELEDAANVLLKLDGDDDELITIQEIVPAGNPNFGRPIIQPPPVGQPGFVSNTFFTITGETDASLALILLSHYDRNNDRKLSRIESGLPKDLFNRLDKKQDNELDVDELAGWHHRPADFTFTVRLGKTTAVEMQPVAEKKLATAVNGNVLSLGDAQILVRAEISPFAGRIFAQNQYQFLFRQADVKKKGFLEMKDLQGRGLQFLANIFPLIDRNGDGRMTEKELQAFGELQSGATQCFATLSIADQGRNLFQLLDANGDGRLSLREMKTAWVRLKARDMDGDGSLELGEFARQFQLVAQHGQGFGGFRQPVFIDPRTQRPVAAVYPRNAPGWFKKMDRNGDGDVSAREFLGTREQFNRIDADRDGLISVEEAVAYETRLREKQK